MPIISVQELLSYSMRKSPNFSGAPTVAGNNILTLSSDGDIQANNQSVIVKTKEYRMPTTWEGIADYTYTYFRRNLAELDYGSLTFTPSTTTVHYVDPSATTNGTGTIASPYNVWPTTITLGASVLLKERTTLNVPTAITITAKNIFIGTYDAITGERVVDPNRIATISFASMTGSLFNYSVTASAFTISGIKFVCSGSAAYNRIWANTDATISTQIEYCVFSGITSISNSIITQLFMTNSTTAVVRFNKMFGCNTQLITFSGSKSKVYGNEISMIPYTAPTGYSAATPITLMPGVTGSDSLVYSNYILNPNIASSIYVECGSGPGRVSIYRNMVFGCDNTGLTTSQYCITTTSGTSTIISDNYVVNGPNGIYAPTGTVYKNIVCSQYLNYGIGINGSTVRNNTVIKLSNTSGEGIVADLVVDSNIVDCNSNGAAFNTSIRMASASTAVTKNCLFGAVESVKDMNFSAVTPSVDNILVSAFLDYYFRPFSTSPVLNAGTTTPTIDVFGIIGAMQKVSEHGAAYDLFLPNTGLNDLKLLLDAKADMASPSFSGIAKVNNNYIYQNLYRDFGTETSKTVTGTTIATIGTYSIPSMSVRTNSMYRIQAYYVVAGTTAKTITLMLNATVAGSTISVTTPGTYFVEYTIYNNSAGTTQTIVTNMNGSVNITTAAATITSGTLPMTIKAVGTSSTDSVTLRSCIVDLV